MYINLGLRARRGAWGQRWIPNIQPQLSSLNEYYPNGFKITTLPHKRDSVGLDFEVSFQPASHALYALFWCPRSDSEACMDLCSRGFRSCEVSYARQPFFLQISSRIAGQGGTGTFAPDSACESALPRETFISSLAFSTKFQIYVRQLSRSVWKNKHRDRPKRGDVTGWFCSRTDPA